MNWDSEYFLGKGKKLYPKFHETVRRPLPETEPDREQWMRCGSNFTLDFGTHLVGYVTLRVACDHAPDSPLQAVFEFAEDRCEFDPAPYKGGLSSSWIQRETVFSDNALEPLSLPRRYAFRYLRITFPANTAFQVRYVSCEVRAVTSADMSAVTPLPEGTSEAVRKIDEIAIRTLKNCMQSVFEDGPKRDRRLWLGDLYLQAKANYLTFKNTDLVKRCLYLFAGIPHENGCLSSAIFQEPILMNQSWILHDYALFFAGCLKDLYEFEGDRETVRELWPVAFRQAEIASEAVNEKGLVDPAYYFVDWCAPLDKTAAAQGIAVAMLKDTLFLAKVAGDAKAQEYLEAQIERLSGALLSLYDRDKKLFVAPGGQISVQSQMWGILAGVLDEDEVRNTLTALRKLTAADGLVDTVTPYAKHYYVDALLKGGFRQEAEKLILEYWGGMAEKGADCFWEVYVPDQPELSPYGDKRINSFCHAWSCTPTYFIRKYGIK